MVESGRPNWARFTSLGFELAAAILGFSAMGYLIDRHFETAPWGLLICALLGIVGGLYNLVKAALKASNASSAAVTETDTNTD